MKVSVWMPVKVRAPPRSPNAQTSRPDVGGVATGAAATSLRPEHLPTPQRRRTLHQPAQQWRGIATRYDKLACHYQAAVTLVSTLLWINK
jgi:hypothetical protein